MKMKPLAQVPVPRWGSAIWRKPVSFVRGAEGGAMVIAQSFLIVFLGGLGAAMVNYSWRDAQWAEVHSAQRAAAAAGGVLLQSDPDKAREVTEAVLEALVPGLVLPTVTVTTNSDGTINIEYTGGALPINDLWGGERQGSLESLPDSEYKVEIDHSRYEVALALDISRSMGDRFGHGPASRPKIDSLKDAVRDVTTAVRAVNQEYPGAIMVSVVPFSALVNVADTDASLPLADATAPQGRTKAKERYVRMLAGAEYGGSAIAIGSSTTPATTLFYAKAAADNRYGQWVDTFHRYGDGKDMGALRAQGLPDDLLRNANWNLRRTARTIDISTQRPANPNWTVDDIDFWNGCLMARWGAYWATLDDSPSSRTWPVSMDAPAWSPKGNKLAGAPLHLSDVPPDAANPHTLFTAYSWPDASISAIDPGSNQADVTQGPGSADHWLQVVMARMLRPSGTALPLSVEGFGRRRYNDWNAGYLTIGGTTIRAPRTRNTVNSGHAMCPKSAILPLTDDADQIEDYVNDFEIAKYGPSGSGVTRSGALTTFSRPTTTYLPRGLAWALRTISPLWQSVWDLQDLRGESRPVATCGAGEVSGCDLRTQKSIILVSDGGNVAHSRFGAVPSTTGVASDADLNPLMELEYHESVCIGSGDSQLTNYHNAWAEPNEASFNAQFKSAGVRLDNNGHFDSDPSDPMDRALEAFKAFEAHYPSLAGDSTRHTARAAALRDFTPWEFFRSSKLGIGSTAADAIMDPNNKFVDTNSTTVRSFGRPVQIGSWCQPQIYFGPYGGYDELVLVGSDGAGTTGDRRPPEVDVAPFADSDAPAPTTSEAELRQITRRANAKLDGWMNEVCDLIGQRGVGMHAIFLGGAQDSPKTMKDCITNAGGDWKSDLYATPNSQLLEEAFRKLFRVERTLRFL